jgi:hypothetical protein
VTTTWLYHYGVAYGPESHVSVYPKYGLVVMVLMDRNSTSAGPFGEDATRLTDLAVSAIERAER